MHRHLGLGVVGVDLVVHQVLELERVHIARHHQAQVVGDELEHVVVGQHQRVLGEQLALLGLLDVALDGHHAVAADLVEQREQQQHQLEIERAVVARALEQGRQRLHGGLDRLAVVAGNEGAEGGATDHQHLQRLEKHDDVAASQGKAAQHRSHHHDIAQNHEHDNFSQKTAVRSGPMPAANTPSVPMCQT